MQQRSRAAEHLSAAAGADRTEVGHAIAVDPRLHTLAEIRLIVDDSTDDQAPAGGGGDVDRLCGSLVGMDATEGHEASPPAASNGSSALSTPW